MSNFIFRCFGWSYLLVYQMINNSSLKDSEIICGHDPRLTRFFKVCYFYCVIYYNSNYLLRKDAHSHTYQLMDIKSETIRFNSQIYVKSRNIDECYIHLEINQLSSLTAIFCHHLIFHLIIISAVSFQLFQYQVLHCEFYCPSF